MAKDLDYVVSVVALIRDAIDTDNVGLLLTQFTGKFKNEESIRLRLLANNIITSEIKTEPVTDEEGAKVVLEAFKHKNKENFYLKLAAKLYSSEQ